LPVDIIGVNEINGGSNPLMYAGKRLSWVRDTAGLGIEASWGAVYRDVIILGPNNGMVDSYNLLSSPINGTASANVANRAAMKSKLIAAATPVDSDNDKLPDFWEILTYGDLTRSGASVEAGAGVTALQRYAHCGGVAGTALVDGLPRVVGLPDGSVSVIYTRRRETAFGLTVAPEFSRTLVADGWETAGHGWEEWSTHTLYDGSCGELVEWKILSPGEWRFLRVRSSLP
jgi:hypothetical protein